MKVVKVLLLFSFALSFAACSRKSDIVFKGHLDNCVSNYIYFSEIRPDGPDFIDSFKIENGDFVAALSSDFEEVALRRSNPVFIRVTLDNKNFGFTTLAKAGEVLTVSGNATDFPQSYSVSGSVEAENMLSLDKQLALFIDSTDYLFEVYQANVEDDDVRAQVENVYMQIVRHHTDFLLTYIRNHPNSLSSIAAFYQKYERRIFVDEEENVDVLNELYGSLSVAYPNNENVDFLKKRLDLLKR